MKYENIGSGRLYQMLSINKKIRKMKMGKNHRKKINKNINRIKDELRQRGENI